MILFRLKLDFYDDIVSIRKRYSDDYPMCWDLHSLAGGALLTATVGAIGIEPRPGFIFINDWSKYEGLLESLISGRIVEYTGETLTVGCQRGSICRVLIPELAS